MRKSKLDRDTGRDISEKIALGLHKGSGKLTGESMFDSRLFNQSSGISSGFGADDEYSAFTKPLFDRGEAASIYRYSPPHMYVLVTCKAKWCHISNVDLERVMLTCTVMQTLR